MIDESLTRKEFTESFKKIMEFLTKLKEKNQGEFKNLNQKFSDQSNKMTGDNTSSISTLKAELMKLIEAALTDQATGMNLIRDKMRKIKEGTDGKDGASGMNGRPGIDGKDGVPGKDAPTIKKIRKALKKKLRISDIKGLQEELKKRGQTIMTGGGSGGGHIVKAYDLSDQLNGTLKTFSLPAFWRIISVHSSSFPNAFRPTTDFTSDASAFTITFTSEILSSSTLAAGQTIIVTYSE